MGVLVHESKLIRFTRPQGELWFPQLFISTTLLTTDGLF